jgi:hypothetical protein
VSDMDQNDQLDDVEEYVSGEELISRAVADANAPEPEEVVEEVFDEQSFEEDSANEMDELILGKFKSSDDLAAAYKELERKFHEKQQAVEEEEWDDDPAPLVTFSGGVPETEDDLVEWSADDPTAAALWAIENRNRVSEETFNEVYRSWWQERPWEAAAFQREQDMLMMQEYMAQQVQPFQSQHEQQMMERANQTLLERIPDIEEYAPKIQKFIEENDVSGLIGPDAMGDPEMLANGIDMIIGILKWKEHQNALRTNPAIVEDQSPVNQITAVSTGNTAMADDSLDDPDEILRNFILNG